MGFFACVFESRLVYVMSMCVCVWCVCVCVCVCVCTHTHTPHTHTHIDIDTCIHTHTYTHIDIDTYIHILHIGRVFVMNISESPSRMRCRSQAYYTSPSPGVDTWRERGRQRCVDV
jgi:hypothetical protein